jgi:hypothetical protein
MVFTAVDERRVQSALLTPNDAVVAVRIDYLAAIKNILQVLPDTKNVVVIVGTSPIMVCERVDQFASGVPIAGTSSPCASTHMTDIDRDMCRKAAAECVELARVTTDPAKKEILLIRAQEWIKLAYAKNDTELQQHLAQLNDAQMGATPVQRTSMQQQPVQQQQAKKETD